jgi:hypothetical protein
MLMVYPLEQGVIRVTKHLMMAVVYLVCAGCGYIEEHTAPVKMPSAQRSPEARAADALFWETFRRGRYENIQAALEAETRAYLADPRDVVSAAHIGWLHIWRLSERSRLAEVPATITDDALLARRYFQEAVDMSPADARYLGFLATTTLADGSLNKNERVTRRGYRELLQAIAAWPEFNLFTAGYSLSAQPLHSREFTQALQWQWRDIDVCAGGRIDRRNPDFSNYMHLEKRTGNKRACWNSEIAPHNFEGFFLNMGDMLVKAGDAHTARIIYGNAKLSPSYPQWPYRAILEQRLRLTADSAKERPGEGAAVTLPLMLESTYSCMACHQQ